MARRSGKRSDGIGYGHPPPEGQFKAGTSGNYRGRPRKPRSHRVADPLDDDAFSREARRMLKHQEGDHTVESMALDLVTRRVFQEAIKGKQLAAKLVFDERRRREERQRRTRDDVLSNAFDRKREWAETKREQVRRGGKVSALEPPVPHPDEFLITRHGDVHSMSLQSQAAIRKLVEQRDEARGYLSVVQMKLRRLEPGPHSEGLTVEARDLARRIKEFEQAIPDFWDDVVFELFGEPPPPPIRDRPTEPTPKEPPRRRSRQSG